MPGLLAPVAVHWAAALRWSLQTLGLEYACFCGPGIRVFQAKAGALWRCVCCCQGLVKLGALHGAMLM